MSKTETLSILYVEDEAELREIICEFLKMESFDCISAANGKEATELLKQRHFDVVLTDLSMPLMDGSSLLFWCREKGFHMPVIFFAGSLDRTPEEEKALEDCCTSIVIKPAPFEKIVQEINKARQRNHEFDCRGKVLLSREESHFAGQHIME